jgi:DnaA-homolog protein
VSSLAAMQQVPLPLVPRAQGRFDNYLPGPNAAVVAQLASELPPRAPVYLWGEPGSGKTHLLQAVAHACRQRGLPVGLFEVATPLPWAFDEHWRALLFDDVHAFSAEQQHQAFALCVEAQTRGLAWLASGAVPPVDLPLRDDLRSRLAWGQTHALKTLHEEETLAALGQEAERRGIALTPEVLRYLLSRYSRDLSSLMRLLDRLDQYSLARGRAVTVPLLRTLLADLDAAGVAGAEPRT